MGQHCSKCSLRAGLESVWHWTFAGAQWADRALLAGTFWQVQGKGALLTPVAGAGLCVAVRQQGVVQDCSLEKCSHVGLDVEHETKAEGQNNIFFHASLHSLCGHSTHK